MKIGRNISLTDRNTFGMKVSCACLVEYDSPEEYRELLSSEVFHTLPLPFLHIGGGSNLLFTADFPGTVFHSRIGFLKEVSRDGDSVRIEAGSGTLWDKVCLYCAENGLWGTENLSGIRGGCSTEYRGLWC